jgi:hypothetical protein
MRQCEVNIRPLMIPCGNPTETMYEARCERGHVRIKWACKECAEYPHPVCGGCAEVGMKYSPVKIRLVEEGYGVNNADSNGDA